jgi:hypothetical protein
VLSNGKEINYASGLFLGDYRGLKTIEHSGSDAGFRADYLRFPDEKFSIVLLSNLGSVDPGSFARKIADIYLADRLKPVPQTQVVAPPIEVKIDPRVYDNYCGDYLLSPDLTFSFFRQGDQLWLEATGRGKMQVFPMSETEFFFKGIDARFHFILDKDGKAQSVLLNDGGEEMAGPRFTRVVPKSKELAEYAGDYYSDELSVLYVLSQEKGGLMLRYPRGVLTLEPIQRDTFVGGYPVGNLQFIRDPATKAIRGFKLMNGRVRNLSFERIQVGNN